MNRVCYTTYIYILYSHNIIYYRYSGRHNTQRYTIRDSILTPRVKKRYLDQRVKTLLHFFHVSIFFSSETVSGINVIKINIESKHTLKIVLIKLAILS